MDVNFSLQEINEVAKKLIAVIPPNSVICLYGEMGAGKTTLVSAICEAMGVTDMVSSPTFSIINEYTDVKGQAIYHLDLYRIKDHEEAIAAGVEHCLYAGNLCLVEWPENAYGLLPDDAIACHLYLLPNNYRKLEIKL